MKKIAIMQPYFLPYIGYFQLLNAVDEFIVYDNIEFSKKGWVQRNRILVNAADAYITLPLKKDSDYLDIRQRYLADTWPEEKNKMINRICESYRKAPFANDVLPVVEAVLAFPDRNLFAFLFHSLGVLMRYLGITTRLVVSSSVPVNHGLKAEEKVIALCLAQGATHYLNPIGGKLLYQKEEFNRAGIALSFLEANRTEYTQLTHAFIPFLSVIDVLMFNPLERVRHMLSDYTLH